MCQFSSTKHSHYTVIWGIPFSLATLQNVPHGPPPLSLWMWGTKLAHQVFRTMEGRWIDYGFLIVVVVTGKVWKGP